MRLTSKVQFLAKAAFIVIASLAAYIPAMRGGFIWDDDAYVTENPLLVAPDGLYRIWFSKDQTSQYFPLTFTTFRLEYKLWGFNPRGYHITNILLHIINSLLLWQLLFRLNVPWAWLAAAIFALHPVQVESVAWITERKNVLMTLFFFLSLLAWVRFIEKPQTNLWRFYFLSLGFYALALFSKTTACTIPAALVLLLWIKHIPIDRKRWLQIALFMVLGIAMGLFIVWWEHNIQGTGKLNLIRLNPLERVLLAARALWFYIGKLIWPARLTFSYPKWDINRAQPVQYLWLIAWVIVGWCMWHWREKLGRGFIAGVVFFIATLLPLLGFIPLYTFSYTYVADHYQYVACAGLITLAVALACRAAERFGPSGKAALSMVSAIILTVYGILTWQQCCAYKDAETLWRDTLCKNPSAWIAHNNLGIILQSQGKIDEAIDHYRRIIQATPNDVEVINNLGHALQLQGRLDEAVSYYRRALEIKPDYAEAHSNLGTALLDQGKTDEAIGHHRRALQLNPNSAEMHNNLGNALLSQNRLDEAVSHYSYALQIKPDYADAHNNIGCALRLQGKFNEAVRHYNRALQLKPDNANIHNNLGLVYVQLGRYNQAIEAYKQAIKIRPDYVEAHFNLGVAYSLVNDSNSALEEYKILKILDAPSANRLLGLIRR